MSTSPGTDGHNALPSTPDDSFRANDAGVGLSAVPTSRWARLGKAAPLVALPSAGLGVGWMSDSSLVTDSRMWALVAIVFILVGGGLIALRLERGRQRDWQQTFADAHRLELEGRSAAEVSLRLGPGTDHGSLTAHIPEPRGAGDENSSMNAASVQFRGASSVTARSGEGP